jgi:hypothetical protein
VEPGNVQEMSMLGNIQQFPLLAALAFIAACDQTASVEAEPAATPTTQAFREFDRYTVFFNAVSTDRLSPEVARQYGIVRSRNRALLTVSILSREDGGLGASARGNVSASAVNLNGQLKSIGVREIDEGTAIYYVGEVAVSNMETLIFSIDVTPAGEPDALSMRFMRQFFGN